MKKFLRPFFLFLELAGLRCAECGSWDSTRTISKELKWGSNAGGLLLMDPYHLKTEVQKCNGCGHVLAERFAGTEELRNAC